MLAHILSPLSEVFIVAVVVCVALSILVFLLLSWFGEGGGLFCRPRGHQMKRCLLVVAHPDDECMFFGPTVSRLCRSPVQANSGAALKHDRRDRSPLSGDIVVFVLCLSTGDNYGQGWCRRDELYASCARLGVPRERVILVQHSQLPDNPHVDWNRPLLVRLLVHHIITLEIDTVLTFDRYGISLHRNHSALYFAARALIRRNHGLPPGCRVFALSTVSRVRKYCGVLDLFPSVVDALWCRASWLVVVASLQDWWRVQCAMKQHASQLVWFRRLYMIFSRYTLINVLVPIESVSQNVQCSSSSSSSSSDSDCPVENVLKRRRVYKESSDLEVDATGDNGVQKSPSL